jgi:hypothetical protein
MGAAGKRAHSATESKPPDGDRPPDPPEELLVLHLDDEDASDSEEVAIDSHGRVNGVTACVTTRDAHVLDVRTKVATNALPRAAAADLFGDVEAAVVGDSFWLGVDAQPRCALEHLARAVFSAHARGCASRFDARKTGAEWWVQLRRDTCEGERVNPFNPDDASDPAGVSFHWDKDESLVDAYGVNVHPALSTVTYLRDSGAPTMVADKTAPVMYEDIEAFRGAIPHAVLSHPETGKHLSFDGRMLHGAPRELARAAALAGGAKKKPTRATFLVNVWLGHKPADVEPFPAEALGEFPSSASASVGDAFWTRTARAMEANIRRDAAPPSRRADVKDGDGRERREYAFGETGTEHVLVLPRLGDGASGASGASGDGTVAFRFDSRSGCAVVEHPSRKRRRSARGKGR